MMEELANDVSFDKHTHKSHILCRLGAEKKKASDQWYQKSG